MAFFDGALVFCGFDVSFFLLLGSGDKLSFLMRQTVSGPDNVNHRKSFSAASEISTTLNQFKPFWGKPMTQQCCRPLIDRIDAAAWVEPNFNSPGGSPDVPRTG